MVEQASLRFSLAFYSDYCWALIHGKKLCIIYARSLTRAKRMPVGEQRNVNKWAMNITYVGNIVVA